MEPASLVIGLGNALQGADGFGPAVIDRLRRADVPGGTTLLDAGTDLLGHLDRLAAFDRVILVDAMVGGAGTGAVTIVGEAAISRWSIESPDSHAVSAVLAVGLFRRLYPAAARTTIALVGLDAPHAGAGAPLVGETIEAGATAVLRLLAAD
jgi:hydrogenase maturation protease